MHTLVDSSTLTYGQIRLSWCRAHLAAFLRRWGIYIAAAVLVLGGTGNGPAASMSSLLALPLLPLIWAEQHSVPMMLVLAAAYCAFGSAICWAMRPLLWPSSWRDVEWSLPVSPKLQQRSDLAVLAIGLSPWFSLYVAGLVVWLVRTSDFRLSTFCWLMAVLVASMAVSLSSGTAILRSMRMGDRAARHLPASIETLAASIGKPWLPTTIFFALILFPLVRGPARRAGHLLLLTPVLAFGHAVILFQPAATSWWLAGFALLTLVLSTRLSAVLEWDLAQLHDACAPLPLTARRMRLSRQAVAMLPVTTTTAVLLALILGCLPQVRALPATGYLLTVSIGNLLTIRGIQAGTHASNRPENPNKAAAWLVLLATQIAFASEILPP